MYIPRALKFLALKNKHNLGSLFHVYEESKNYVDSFIEKERKENPPVIGTFIMISFWNN